MNESVNTVQTFGRFTVLLVAFKTDLNLSPLGGAGGQLQRVSHQFMIGLRAGELVLGPFQGKPACTRIALDEGVCGTAASTLQTQRVADVQAFPGHIVCDPDSRSELVVPLFSHGQLIGVLDIDSPITRRFSETDQTGVEKLCDSFCELQEKRKYFI